MRLTKAAVLMTLLTLFVTPRALAASEVSEAHAIVEAGASQSTVPGVWDFHPTYSVSVLRLDESGQGFGGRVTLLPSPEFAGAREFSADAVARLANDGPLYLKVIAGAAWVPANGLWPPRVRAGAEVGLTAIRSAFGLEAGLAAVYTFPPSRPGGGEWVISAGVGILWGFGAPSRAPALTHIEDPATEQPAWSPGGFGEPHGPVLTSGLGGVVGRPSAAARSETQPLRFEGRDVIHQILLLRKPGDVMSWWNSEDVDRWTQPLSAWEEKYIEAMSSPTVPEPIRMWPPVTPENLTADQVEEMEHLWGKLADPRGYSNWKNRHRILKHYFMTHPATIRLLMQLYEVSRDANLLAFSLERGWQMGSGKEMFTDQDVSRLGAAAEFFTALATTVAVGKLLKAARPVAERSVDPPLEPAGSGSAGEVHSPDATGQVVPLDRARTPRNPPPSPASQPLSSVEEQPLAATGTDGGPVLRRQAAPGNAPTVASLAPPGQGARRGAAVSPSASQPPRSIGRGSNMVGSRPNAPPERPDALASTGTGEGVTRLESELGSTSSDPVKGQGPALESSEVRKVNGRVPSAAGQGGVAAGAGGLRSIGNGVWESAAGLRYDPGSAQGNRVLHVLEHAADIPTRAGAHGVFSGGRSSVIGTIDDAYRVAQAGGSGVSVVQQGARAVYTVDMGRTVGFVGGQAGAAMGNPAASHVRLVLEGTNVITAFPVIP